MENETRGEFADRMAQVIFRDVRLQIASRPSALSLSSAADSQHVQATAGGDTTERAPEKSVTAGNEDLQPCLESEQLGSRDGFAAFDIDQRKRGNELDPALARSMRECPVGRSRRK